MKHFVILYLALLCPASAQLTWQTRQLEFHPKLSDTEVDASYPFVNQGKYPVTIKDIKTSCGCTTAVLDKRLYNPGESGKIEATYHIGASTGLQQKTITVQTDDTSEPFVQLALKSYVPELVTMVPSYLFWNVGDDKTPKTIAIHVVYNGKINILGVNSTHEEIFAQLKTVKAGADYQIVVTPTSTALPARATLRIDSDFPAGSPKSFDAYADIRQSQ